MACCPCPITQICSYEIIARKWSFPVNGIVNNTCGFCPGYNAQWLLVFNPNASIGGGWVAQPLVPVPCYQGVTDAPWEMICALDVDNILRFHLGMYGTNHNRFCPQQDSFDDWSHDALTFNPVGPNVMVHTSVDQSGCRPCDASGVEAITITPVF